MKLSINIAAVRATTTGAAIRSVLRQTWSDWELSVVGQGNDTSVRAETERVAAGDSRVRYIHSERRGATIATNVGIHAATGEIVVLLDDDCEAHPEWLATIAHRFANNPEVGVVSGAVIAPEPMQKHFALCPQVSPVEIIYDPAVHTAGPPAGWGWISANVAFRREMFSRTGLFDEYLGPGTEFPAADDTDILLRMEANKVKMLSTPDAIVYHTYGYRYGFKAVYNHSRNYAQGNGALAAKLTLMGDLRGREWVRDNIRAATLGQFPRLYRLPVSLLRLYHFVSSNQRCLRAYGADPATGTLYPLARASLAGERRTTIRGI